MTDADFHRDQARAAREAAIGHRRAGDELDLLALDRVADKMEQHEAGAAQSTPERKGEE
jgi:hypothetical protein